MRTSCRALLLALLAACSVEAEGAHPNVLLICLDTVRADRLGAYGYQRRATTPFLDQLAARSIVFEDASATAGWTKPSVPSFLTGTYPCQHGVYEGSARGVAGAVTDVLPAEALTLAEAFRARGYATAAFVENAQLRKGNGFEQGFDLYVDGAGTAREIAERALAWVAEHGDRPWFVYLHFLDAHWPYAIPDADATRWASAEAIAPYRTDDGKALRDAINHGEVPYGPAEREALEALYDAALRYLDGALADLFARLDARADVARTIACVIADHGEEFGEHGRIGHGHGLWQNLLRVPWILRAPGRAPARIQTPVSLVDLFPTLLGAAGWPVPVPVEGIDRLRAPDALRPVLAEHKAPDRYQQALRQSSHKLVRTFTPSAPELAAERFPVEVGERWEVELERDARGALVATQLKPRQEPPEDPLELKGRLSGLEAARFLVDGIPVRLADDAKISPADDSAPRELAEGLLVKARGAFEDEVFLADRVKTYPATEDPVFELRGSVAEVHVAAGEGSVSIGALSIRVDARTGFKELENDEDQEPRMAREEVRIALELGASASRARGMRVDATTFDLASDPAELAGVPAAEDETQTLLDSLGRALLGRASWSASDRRALTPEALEALKAIGYAR
jgi:arylsulfatase A-like enzyme